mgnify:CR=1 FL=1
MSRITFMFVSGKCLSLETEAESIAQFFEDNQDDKGEIGGWLVFADGYAVQVDNVDWMLLEASEGKEEQ